jgi:hypothetical protein
MTFDLVFAGDGISQFDEKQIAIAAGSLILPAAIFMSAFTLFYRQLR